jgi:hypothetical protein
MYQAGEMKVHAKFAWRARREETAWKTCLKIEVDIKMELKGRR